jgi:hypothetical protein
MSTAYPPRLIKYALSSKKEREAARSSPMIPDFYGHFPNTFGLFYSKPGSDFLSQHFELALRQDESSTEPREVLYAITFHKAPGSGQTTIYSTPEHGSAPLAFAVNDRRYSASANITLPSNGSGSKNMMHLKHSGFGMTGKHTFQYQGEDFTWREDSATKPTVRRLVRPASTSAIPASASMSERKSQAGDSPALPGSGEAIDEHLLKPANTDRTEILATWTEGTVPNRKGMLAAMKFADNGIAVALGEYFVLLAVVSVLFACQNGRAVDSKCSGS